MKRFKAKGQISKVIEIAFFKVHEQGTQRREEEDCGKGKASHFCAGGHEETEQSVRTMATESKMARMAAVLS